MRKKSRRLVMVMLLAVVLSASGVVFADSGISTRASTGSGSVELPSGGTTTNTGSSGKKTTTAEGVTFYLRSSTRDPSSSYPLYFHLATGGGTVLSNTATIKSAVYPVVSYMGYYNSLSSTTTWYIYGRTDSSSKYSTTITFTYGY